MRNDRLCDRHHYPARGSITILTTILITCLPTYGAAVREMILRIVGAIIGGAVSLLAIIIVTPNFETLPAYLLAVFIVFYVSGYSSLASGRVAYAGKQIGTTFALGIRWLEPCPRRLWAAVAYLGNFAWHAGCGNRHSPILVAGIRW